LTCNTDCKKDAISGREETDTEPAALDEADGSEDAVEGINKPVSAGVMVRYTPPTFAPLLLVFPLTVPPDIVLG
jgi:hypothetical protein